MNEATRSAALSSSLSLTGYPSLGLLPLASPEPTGLRDRGPVTFLHWAWSPLEMGATDPPSPPGLLGCTRVSWVHQRSQRSRLECRVPLPEVLKSSLCPSWGEHSVP